MRPESTRRLFFALWPNDSARTRLAAAVREFVPGGAGRPQRPDQWHVTLEFLGDVPEAGLPGVLDAAATAATEAFACELEFEALRHWKRPQVLCLVASATPGPLAALVHSLRSELKLRGFRPDPRPFRPHVTIARKVRQEPPSARVEPFPWPVRAFSLVQSIGSPEGSRYVDLASWPARA